jgi:NAD(P)H-dependent flavin oxidoreductase YrpB (nitropropane dioxygenase family)
VIATEAFTASARAATSSATRSGLLVRVGTAFLACPEGRTHPDYVANLLTAAGEETVLTEWFNEGWPNAPHRVLRVALDAAQRRGVATNLRPATTPQPVTDMAQYAGTRVGGITTSQSAHQVLRHLVSRPV